MTRALKVICGLLVAASFPVAALCLWKPKVNQTPDNRFIYWVAPRLFASSRTPVLNVVNIASSPQYLAVHVNLQGRSAAVIGAVPGTLRQAGSDSVDLRFASPLKPRETIRVTLADGIATGDVSVAAFPPDAAH